MRTAVAILVATFLLGVTSCRKSSPDPEPASTAQVAPVAEAVVPDQLAMHTDLAGVEIPEQAVRGRLDTVPFAPNSITYNRTSTILAFSQGSGFFKDQEVKLFLHAYGEQIDGFERVIAAGDEGALPHLHVGIKAPDEDLPAYEIYTQGYALKLQLGTLVGDQLPGTIYCCLEGKNTVVFAGTFTATVTE